MKARVDGVPMWCAYRTVRGGRDVVVLHLRRARVWLWWRTLMGLPVPGDRGARHAAAP